MPRLVAAGTLPPGRGQRVVSLAEIVLVLIDVDGDPAAVTREPGVGIAPGIAAIELGLRGAASVRPGQDGDRATLGVLLPVYRLVVPGDPRLAPPGRLRELHLRLKPRDQGGLLQGEDRVPAALVVRSEV